MTKDPAASPNTKGEPLTKAKQCFVITPIGKEASAERRRADGLYHAVLKPVLESHDYVVYAAHQVAVIGSITDKIISDILYSELVVADLSGLNPNVMYELAVRHATGLPVVVIADESTALPFDIKQERTLFYRDDFSGCMQLRRDLDATVKSIESGKSKNDNPITRVSNRIILNPTVKVAATEEVILERIDSLAEQVATLNRRQYYRHKSYANQDSTSENSNRIFLDLQVNPETTTIKTIRTLIAPLLKISPEDIHIVGLTAADKVRVSIELPDGGYSTKWDAVRSLGDVHNGSDTIKILDVYRNGDNMRPVIT